MILREFLTSKVRAVLIGGEWIDVSEGQVQVIHNAAVTDDSEAVSEVFALQGPTVVVRAGESEVVARLADVKAFRVA